jgi:hypothetical protein
MHARAGEVDELVLDDVQPVLDAVDRFRADPLPLRTISATDLLVLPGFSRTTAGAVIRLARRDSTLSIDAIADSLCLSPDQRVMLFSCATMQAAPVPVRVLMRARIDASLAMMQRTMVSTPFGSFTATTVRAADERFSEGFLSGSFHTSVNGWTFMAGDMRLTCGRGLVFGGASFAGATVVNSAAIMHDARMAPWTSTLRTGYMRGISVHVGPATAVVDQNGHPGGMLQWPVARGCVGVAAMSDGEVTICSVFGSQFIGPSEIAWEAAAMQHGIALSTSITVPMVRGRVVIAPRLFTEKFTSPHAVTFSAASAVTNEAGIYSGIQWHGRSDALTAACDVRWSLTRRYGVPAPGAACELFGEWRHMLERGTAITTRLRYVHDVDGIRPLDSVGTHIVARSRLSVRVDAETQVLATLRLRCRLQWQQASWDVWRSSELGTMASAEMRWQVVDNLSVMFRWTVYRVSAFDAAIYQMEDLVPGLMRSTMLMHRGGRVIGSVRWKANDVVAISAGFTTPDPTLVVQTDVRW